MAYAFGTMTVPSRLTIACCAGLLAASPALAAFEKEQAELDALLARRKVLSAAQYIDGRPELRSQPRFLRNFSHILVTSYATTINFKVFALRDLEEGEQIEKIRGTPGEYLMIGGDLERLLHDALAARPDDPDLQFAVGEYLSRGKACRCLAPELFTGGSADEFPYLERAWRAGLHDDWSLFRMGVHYLGADKPDLAKATDFLERSLKANPDQVAAHYNAAIAWFQLGKYPAAREHSAAALGRYGKSDLDADTYNVHGRVEQALGNAQAAEAAFRKALELRPAHDGAFRALLGQLRSQKRTADYQRLAAAFIALDYANTWPFGIYLSSVQEAGVGEADRALGRELAAREYARPLEVGASFYGLGKLAELDADTALAHQRYRKSLDGLRKAEKAPPGAIDVVSALVERTRPR